MIGRLKEILPLLGGGYQVTFTLREHPGKIPGDTDLEITAKKPQKKRSLDANAFCWALCSDIGKAITPPVEKEEIYRRAIRAVGVYTPLTMVAWYVDTLREKWEANGTGWFLDVVDAAGIGKKLINLYYGTSTYTAEEMRRVIDWLVDQAEQMEIPIPLSKAEQERLLAQWDRKKGGAK